MNKNRFHLNDTGLQYLSRFVNPAFVLWRDEATLIENIFDLFTPFGVELTNIRTENEGESINDKAIVVSLEDLGEFSLRYGNIGWESENKSQQELSDIIEILGYINTKLPSICPDLKYDSHYLEFGGHGGLETGTSFQDVLQQFHEPKFKSINQNLPSGLILNWLDIDNQRRFHFEIDESLEIPGGLFLRLVIQFRKDKLEVMDLREAFFVTLTNVLAELNLELES